MQPLVHPHHLDGVTGGVWEELLGSQCSGQGNWILLSWRWFQAKTFLCQGEQTQLGQHGAGRGLEMVLYHEWDRKDEMVVVTRNWLPQQYLGMKQCLWPSMCDRPWGHRNSVFPPGLLYWVWCSPDLQWEKERMTNPCQHLARSLVGWKVLLGGCRLGRSPHCLFCVADKGLLHLSGGAEWLVMSSLVAFPFLCACVSMH